MIVELKKITKYYKNSEGSEKRIILDDLSLSIENGESIAVVGPSGSGKSTLLNVLSSLDTCNSGSITFNGQNLSELNGKELAIFRNQNLGFVFQSHHLLPQLSLIENVLLPFIPVKDRRLKKEAEKRALELLSYVGLSNQIHQRPGQMSGGECQRAAVVRALIHQPNLILADEPTGSLDKKSAEQLGDLLVNINKKQAVSLVVVTHSMDLAKKMKKIYQLEDGKLVLINNA
ncbi:ABC transporter ATP-binding protein [Labilibaculum sp.]|uniref:ABC transporter ATP-binding protein n=1 Tax=Labilibaculum sp. TaxID=2060723 RepID=UPI003562F63C